VHRLGSRPRQHPVPHRGRIPNRHRPHARRQLLHHGTRHRPQLSDRCGLRHRQHPRLGDGEMPGADPYYRPDRAGGGDPQWATQHRKRPRAVARRQDRGPHDYRTDIRETSRQLARGKPPDTESPHRGKPRTAIPADCRRLDRDAQDHPDQKVRHSLAPLPAWRFHFRIRARCAIGLLV
jgi:hypothetical protein